MTPKQIDKLPIGTYPMPQHNGLRLEVRASKKSWTLRRRDDDGKLKQIVVGHYPEMSLAGAVAACEQARSTMGKARSVQVTTVRTVLQAYVTQHIRVRRAAAAHSEAIIWRHLGDLADRDAAGIGRRDAHLHLLPLTDRPAIQRRLKMELSAAWELAMASGDLPDGPNPWAKIKAAPVGRCDRVLSDGETLALTSWLRAAALREATRDVLLVTLGTGCRSGEVVGMRWADLDLDAGEWTLERTKNGLGRTVFLNTYTLGNR